MAKQLKFKFYTQRRNFLDLTVKAGDKAGKFKSFTGAVVNFFYYIGLGVIKFFSKFFGTAIAICFHTGQVLISVIIKTYKAAGSDISKTAKNFPARIKLFTQRQSGRSLAIFTIIAFFGFFSIQSLHLVAKGVALKNKIITSAFLGNHYLNQAKDAFGQKDFTGAQNRFALAYQAFNQGQKETLEAGQLFNQLLGLLPQKQDADNLLSAASLVAQSGQDFIDLQTKASLLKISAAGISAGDAPLADVFAEIGSSLQQAENRLNLAASRLDKVKPQSLPPSQRDTFLQLKSKLGILLLSLNNFDEVFTLSQSFLVGQKNLLLIFANNNELRAGGGFMGTYGNLKISNGQIASMKVSSIYDLDGQLQEIIKPPHPLLNVNDRWFLRDANWFADFPSAAKTITTFYEKEGGETPDLIISITPQLIVDLLKIVGPVSLPKYGVVLTPENFVEQTQVATTLTEGLPTNSPKQILADLVPILLQKLSEQESGAWPQIILALQNNLNEKQIVAFAKDLNSQQQLKDFHWAGAIENTDRDYLAVVSSNLGGTKSDLSIKQALDLTTTIKPDGAIINDLSITRTNLLPPLAKTNNDSFLRIYVPKGSKLISNTGFDFKDLSYPERLDYKINDDLYTWEVNSVQDVVTGTTIGQEAGKTFFGNWLNVKGGETRTVKLSYELPFKVSNIDRYSLLAQKQIGSLPPTLNWHLNFSGWQIAWKNFDTESLNTSDLSQTWTLNKDYLPGLVLQKR